MKSITLGEQLDFATLAQLQKGGVQITLSEKAKQRIVACKNYLDNKLAESDQLFYGINTGFGALCNIAISKTDLTALQRNLVMSHACGTGPMVAPELIRLMLVLKIQSLAYGHSGVQLATVERLITLYNHDYLPVIYEQGSLGASGDLAPLAHLVLPLLGMGELWIGEKRIAASTVMNELGWEPLLLGAKEGLALLNGTQFMTAYGVYAVNTAQRLLDQADMVAALSLEAFDGRLDAFHPLIHAVRPHQGQVQVAANMLRWLADSPAMQKPKKAVQDPYSFRCIPQVHGASRDAWSYVAQVMTVEMNAVSDNPNIFPDADLIVSGGNFHGQPLALALDFLAMAMAEIGSISERRTYQLIAGVRDLPAFLIARSGLNSGMMIPQYTAASIASQNKQLANPASTDSIVSSNGQEDHVSMGANAATKLYRILDNVETLLAIELMNAAQALDLRKGVQSSVAIEKIRSAYRQQVPFLDEDRYLHPDIQTSKLFLRAL
jgi:histidine ammonia-lyase